MRRPGERPAERPKGNANCPIGKVIARPDGQGDRPHILPTRQVSIRRRKENRTMSDHVVPVPGIESADQSESSRRSQFGNRQRATGTDADPIAELQRSAGNSAVRRLLDVQRQPVTDPLRAPAPVTDLTPRSGQVALGSLSGYRDAAQRYVDGYWDAARGGIDDFKDAISTDFDWDLFAAQVLGNVVWAGACFASGGTGFVVSLTGIALTTAGAAAAVVSAPTFDTKAKREIDDVWNYLNDQVNGVTESRLRPGEGRGGRQPDQEGNSGTAGQAGVRRRDRGRPPDTRTAGDHRLGETGTTHQGQHDATPERKPRY